jgi:hypothetical protein
MILFIAMNLFSNTHLLLSMSSVHYSYTWAYVPLLKAMNFSNTHLLISMSLLLKAPPFIFMNYVVLLLLDITFIASPCMTWPKTSDKLVCFYAFIFKIFIDSVPHHLAQNQCTGKSACFIHKNLSLLPPYPSLLAQCSDKHKPAL